MDRNSWDREHEQQYDEEEAGTHATMVENGNYHAHSDDTYNGQRGRDAERTPVPA
jgi:hypothetical protein